MSLQPTNSPDRVWGLVEFSYALRGHLHGRVRRGCARRSVPLCAVIAVLMLMTVRDGLSLEYFENSSGLDTIHFETGDATVRFGDVNNDGFPDLVTLGDHGNPGWYGEQGVMVWQANCHPNYWSFRQAGNFGYGGMALGDVNADGILDIGYGMHHTSAGSDFGDQFIEVALGDGSGENWTPWDDGLAGNGETYGMFATEFADVDNDGDLDLGVESFGYGNGMRVYLNNFDGTWSQSFQGPIVNSGNVVEFGDINRDGNADLLLHSDSTQIYFGDGLGGFVAADSGLPGTIYTRTSLTMGDVDGDGGMDIGCIVTDAGNFIRPRVFRWDVATEHWQDLTANLVIGSYKAVKLADMNNDGLADLITARRGTSSAARDIQLYLRDGVQGNWVTSANIPQPDLRAMTWMEPGVDLDHNGYPDLGILSDEGSWPSDYNYLHCYVEGSLPATFVLNPVRPNGAEIWRGGSVHTIRWHSGNPARQPDPIRLELSVTGPGGPWTMIADSVADNGAYQWRVPDSLTSDQCYIRYTNQGTAISRAAFVIRSASSVPYLAVLTDSLNFGPVMVGEESTLTFSVSNLGGAELSGTVTAPAGLFECSGGCGEFTLAPGAQQAVSIRFQPVDSSRSLAFVVIHTAQQQAVVCLTGQGLQVSAAPERAVLPHEFTLASPYPNPFNPTTRLSFSLPAESPIRLCVWNLLGERVAVLRDTRLAAGIYSLTVDGSDWPSGLYIFSLETPSAKRVQKALLLK